jgi:hypothetical protein
MVDGTALRLWHVAAIVAVLVAAVVLALSTVCAPRALIYGAQGFPGYSYDPVAFHDIAAQRIVELSPESPLFAAAVKPGDLVVDPPRGVFVRGEAVTLSVARNGTARPVTVAAADSGRFANPTAIVLFLATAWIVLGLAALISVRRRQDFSAMVIAVGLSLAAISLAQNTFPAHRIVGLVDLSKEWLGMLFFPFMAYAALNFDGGYVSAGRRFNLVLIGGFCAAWAVCVGLITPYYLGRVLLPPVLMNGLVTLFRLAAVILCLLAFVDTWRHVNAGSRARLRWMFTSASGVLLTFCLSVAHGLGAFGFTQAVQIRVDTAAAVLLSSAVVLLAYAVLRHRVIDLGFAVSRALVFAIVSGLLLTSFGVTEWLIEHLMHFEAREKSALLDAAIALGIFLIFHRVWHWVRHAVERVFFHAWHLKEEVLKQSLAQASHFVAADDLIGAFLQSVDTFTSSTGSALYLRDDAARFTLANSTLSRLPEHLQTASDLVLHMTRVHGPIDLNDPVLTCGAEMAFPLQHRADLVGLLLVGPKPGREDYRPDEIDSLAHAAELVRVELHALAMEQLKRRTRDLEHENATLHAQLEALKGKCSSGPGLQNN